MTLAQRLSGRLLLHGEPWETYIRMLRVFDERRRLRITFDRGTLELMTLSPRHEHYKSFLGRMVTTLTEEAGLPVASYGSLTLKRRGKQRGLEPDECFWIANADRVRAMRTFDLRRDPPPDLVIEVDMSRSSVDRMEIYADLNVPEVWRFDGRTLTIYILTENTRYRVASSSGVFPFVQPSDLHRQLRQLSRKDENVIIAEFRSWIRRRLDR
jgi:Uma2 family endonuclease